MRNQLLYFGCFLTRSKNHNNLQNREYFLKKSCEENKTSFCMQSCQWSLSMPLKTSENQRFSNLSRGYRKKSVLSSSPSAMPWCLVTARTTIFKNLVLCHQRYIKILENYKNENI